jgi:hypothetical protein
MHHDTKELLLGSAAILLFGVALVVWPSLGYHVHDAVRFPIDLILRFF